VNGAAGPDADSCTVIASAGWRWCCAAHLRADALLWAWSCSRLSAPCGSRSDLPRGLGRRRRPPEARENQHQSSKLLALKAGFRLMPDERLPRKPT
jgi:hypothetical protein